MNNMKAIIKTILLLTILIFLNSSPLYSAEQTTITVWAMGSEGLLIRNMADRFEALHPEVKIVSQSIPWSAAHEKLVTGVIGGMAPDVCQMGTTWMAEFHAMGALEPLDTFLQDSKLIKTDDFFSSSLISSYFDEKYFGLPWYVDTRVFFYRSDLLTKLGYTKFPETWKELKAYSQAIMAHKRLEKQPGYAILLPTNDWQIFLMFFWQAGGALFPNNDLTKLFNPEPAIEALSFLRSFFAENLASLTAGADMDLITSFESGFFPMFIAGPWMVSTLETNKPEMAGKWTTAQMPGRANRSSFIGGSNLVMFKSSQNKYWAWKFIEFLSTAENQAVWYDFSKNLPAVIDAWQSPSLADNPHLAAFRNQLDEAVPPTAIPEWEQVANAVSESMEPVMHGVKAPTEGANKMAEKVAVILTKPDADSGVFALTTRALILSVLVLLVLVAFFKWFPKETDRISAKRFQPEALVFVVPVLVLLATFLFLPILGSLFASFTNWNIYGISDSDNIVWVGLSNYRQLFADPVFWISLRNSLIFALIGVPLNMACSLLTALILNREFIRFKALFRVGYFIPCITTMVAVAVIWRWLYNPEFGLLNLGLNMLGLSGQNWLANEWLALPSLIVMSVWKGFGYNMIIFIAALQSIPDELYESAEIDGADQTRQFWHITLPMLRQTTFFVAIMTSIGFLQFFAEPYIMTGGGPMNQTMSVVLYMYNHGFKYYNLGYASSIAYVLFALILLSSVAQSLIKKALEGGRK
jgi:ABC-type sugar transport system permease subunit/ABC-type glycerol-3-phosphate transport system substrate-binding protein